MIMRGLKSMFKGVIEAENLEDDVVCASLSLNFKLFYNGGELVCDASSLEECKKISDKPKEPETPPSEVPPSKKYKRTECFVPILISWNRSFVWVTKQERRL